MRNELNRLVQSIPDPETKKVRVSSPFLILLS